MKTLTLILSLLVSTLGLTQTNVNQTILSNNLQVGNPAFSGFYERSHASAGYQFSSYKNYYRSSVASANYGILFKGHHGFGVNASSSFAQYGFGSTLSFNYNYQLNLSPNSKLSLGVAPVVQFSRIPIDISDSSTNRTNYLNYGVNFGVAYKYKNLTLGAAYSLRIKTEFPNSKNISSISFYTNYEFKISENFSLIPEVQFSYTPVYSNYSMFGSINAKLYKRMNVGVGLDKNGNGVIQAGYTFKNKLNIGYTYSQNLKNYFGSTHGIGIKFGFK